MFKFKKRKTWFSPLAFGLVERPQAHNLASLYGHFIVLEFKII